MSILALLISFTSLVFGFDEASLVFVGDAMQHQGQLDAARTSEGYDYTGTFDAVRHLVAAADLAVVNLETPVGRPPYTGYPCFNAPPQFVDALADAGFDLFLTANNHTLDRGPRGLHSTIAELDSRNLCHLGTYSSDSARSAALPMVLDVSNFNIGFLNYTYGTNGLSPRDGVVVDYIDRAKILEDYNRVRGAGAELVVVAIHWGDEYRLLPNKTQKDLADFLEAIGVDLVIGSHPHVIQPMELRPNRYYPEKDFLLVYSLGNFISNMKTPDTRGGALTEVRLFRGDDGKARIASADYRLLFTVPGNSPGDNFRVFEADSVRNASWQHHVRDFSRRARAVFNRHNINVPEAKE